MSVDVAQTGFVHKGLHGHACLCCIINLYLRYLKVEVLYISF
jgi:hypothetical protein